MKHLDLNAMGVVEMEAIELTVIDGGTQDPVLFMTQEQIDSMSDTIEYVGGFVAGFIHGVFGF